jgi:hypothetical protein
MRNPSPLPLTTPREGGWSPWGLIDDAIAVPQADGMAWNVSTPSHGGIYLHPHANAQVHPAWRTPSGWYEEDCEWACVAITFPAWFSPKERTAAHTTAKNGYPDEYTAVTGLPVTQTESYVLRERDFRRTHQTNLKVVAGYGDWSRAVPTGMVGVVARIDLSKDGRDRYFLVPEEDYKIPLAFPAGKYEELDQQTCPFGLGK